MAKTTVSSILTQIKRRVDYDISDDDLTNLIVDILNEKLRLIKGLLFDNGFFAEITKRASFKVVAEREYKDLGKAVIVGDTATFTGIAGDKIKVTIDGTAYDDIAINACTDIGDVVAAINLAVGSDVASEDEYGGYLQIESPTSGSSSSVTVADGGTTVQTVVGDLFSVSAERTASGVADVDEIIALSSRDDGVTIPQVDISELVDYQPDPTDAYSTVADMYAQHQNYLWFAPTPARDKTYYIDYIVDVTVITSASTLPFDNKYDGLLVAMARRELTIYFDRSDAAAIQLATQDEERLKHELIIGAAKPLMARQVQSRREDENVEFPREAES